ncbi:MAG: winged helix-turn-helix transcriptional regulator, partial [Dyella sp.]|nr:winged helix-turn-helix transcriptional regulator [Dyella sp.]
DLVDAGLLERRRYSERPRRYEYLLTERGRDFRPVLLALMSWGNRYLAPEGLSIQLTDTDTGLQAEPTLIDQHSGEPITRGRHVITAGPAASERTRARIAARDLRLALQHL